MPDVTVSFTDAQWTRIVAATSYIMKDDEGTVDATKLATMWKEQVTDWVKAYEESRVTADKRTRECVTLYMFVRLAFDTHTPQ